MRNFVSLLLLLFLLLWGRNTLAQTYTSGDSYLDETGYVEYVAGNLPIVLSAPHGGYLEPSSIPNRSCNGCSYVRDSYTQELVQEIKEALFEKTGCYPHMVINLLHRRKFDANRDIGDAADGNSTVEKSWEAYHTFLDQAKATIERDYGRGLFLDMHGHGHEIQRLELGYALSGDELQLLDASLNSPSYVEESSIRNLVGQNLEGLTHTELLRGTSSLGTLLAKQDIPSVPSADDPFPLEGEAYFSGGYNTRRHGSMDGGTIDGIQIECHQEIRFDETRRKIFADSLAQTIIRYLDTHYFEDFIGNYCTLLTNNDEEISSNDIAVFPNPADDQITIKSDFYALNISIYNYIGQEIRKIKWSGQSIDIRNLEKGIYILRFEYEGQIIVSKRLVK